MVWYIYGMKQKISDTLSEECRRLLRLLSERFGVSQAAVIELLVREKAREEGIHDPHADIPLPPAAS